jgi:hypothetical protein
VLSLVLIVAGLAYLVIRRRFSPWSPDFLAFLTAFGLAIVAIAASNRQIRFVFPTIVALPFLTAILISGKGRSNSARFSALAAVLVFGGLTAAALPMRHRPDIQSLSRADAVLARAAACNAKRVILATDSATLNMSLMALAIELSAQPLAKAPQVSTVVYRAMSGVPIEEDFREMSKADQVVFQDEEALDPPFTNLRVSEYQKDIRQSGYVPVKIGDITVYSKQCRP